MKILPKIKIIQKCIVNYGGKILLIKRAEGDSLAGFWDFPGGKLEFLEKMKEGIKREIKEETGLTSEKMERLSLNELVLKDKKKHFILILYKSSVKSDKVKLSKEHDEFLWINKKDLKKYKLNPLIKIVIK